MALTKNTSKQHGTNETGTAAPVAFEFAPASAPLLNWQSRKPFTRIPYYPARLQEVHGRHTDDWRNRIYHGNNLEVMGHLLDEFRGAIDLVYIDPPFDSNAGYKKKIRLRGRGDMNGRSLFEEKQYDDVWADGEYLQFMYERLVLIKELLSEKGAIYVHLDENRSHYLKVVLDEVFGADNFCREIVWSTRTSSGFKVAANNWIRNHDTILFYRKGAGMDFKKQYLEYPGEYRKRFKKQDSDGRLYRDDRPSGERQYLDELKGVAIGDVWDDIMSFQQASTSGELLDYPTQKPEKLIERILLSSSEPGDIVFDCFMGSGTTQAVAMRLGRRFIGADVNPGAIRTATNRLIKSGNDLKGDPGRTAPDPIYTGFSIYRVGDPGKPVHPPGDVQALEVAVEKRKLSITKFLPVKLVRRLGLQGTELKDWRRLVDSVMIDFHYDGKVFTPSTVDIPDADELVRGEYEIPADGKSIYVQVTDILSEVHGRIIAHSDGY